MVSTAPSTDISRTPPRAVQLVLKPLAIGGAPASRRWRCWHHTAATMRSAARNALLGAKAQVFRVHKLPNAREVYSPLNPGVYAAVGSPKYVVNRCWDWCLHYIAESELKCGLETPIFQGPPRALRLTSFL